MSTRFPLLAAAFALSAGFTLNPAFAQDAKDAQSSSPAQSKSDDRVATRVGDPYPLATCPISGGKLGSMGEPIIKSYEGREVRFCCESCPPKFEKDLAKSMVTLDEAMAKDQAPLYPLDTSVVSGKKLGDHPIDWVYGNRLVRLADEGEKAEFLKEPAQHIAALDKAVVAKQGAHYPLKTCPVSQEELGGDMGEPVDLVVAGRLIRLCCSSCAEDVHEDPAKYIAMIDQARGGNQEGAGDDRKSDEQHEHIHQK